jgi:hypothetical protein
METCRVQVLPRPVMPLRRKLIFEATTPIQLIRLLEEVEHCQRLRARQARRILALNETQTF